MGSRAGEVRTPERRPEGEEGRVCPSVGGAASASGGGGTATNGGGGVWVEDQAGGCTASLLGGWGPRRRQGLGRRRRSTGAEGLGSPATRAAAKLGRAIGRSLGCGGARERWGGARGR